MEDFIFDFLSCIAFEYFSKCKNNLRRILELMKIFCDL